LYLRNDGHADDGVLDAARRHWAVEWRRESADAFDEFDGAIGQAAPLPERWSVSQLTTLGQCPFKWFAQRILRLSPAVEGDTDLRNDVLGNLYHRTLEIASRGALASQNFREQVQEKLEASFSEAESDEKISVQQLPNWDVRRLEHLQVLRRAVAAEAFIAPGARAVAIEKEFIGDWEGFPVRGYIDRIDESEDGLTAVDYKTGTYISKAKDDSGELKIDLQLPIYSSTGLPCLFPGKAVAGGRYYSLRQKKDLPAKDANLDGFVRKTQEILAAGTLHVDPDGKQKVCDYCDYDSLCRRGLRQSRKGAAE
jgi:RecB family exonuclease